MRNAVSRRTGIWRPKQAARVVSLAGTSSRARRAGGRGNPRPPEHRSEAKCLRRSRAPDYSAFGAFVALFECIRVLVFACLSVGH
jgi:hypothetical protein